MFGKRRLVTVAVLILAGLVMIVMGVGFKQLYSSAPPISTTCVNDYGHELNQPAAQPLTEAFSKCVRRRVELFLEYDYPESKDLAKSFLTLVSGLLLASIAFSEKIVDFARASWVSKSLMVACWISFLGAIVACGAGLAFMVQAGVWAIHHPFQDYWIFESRAEILFLAAGLSFGVGLATLLTAGIISIVHRPAGAAAG